MPSWLWLVPVPWLAVVAFWVVAAIYAKRRERALGEAREDVERRPEAMLFGYAPHAPVPADDAAPPPPPLDCQRFNPRVHGRPDQWRT